MIFNVYELVSFVSRVMTLLPGDIIATGTPPGVGKMAPGDEVEVRLSGIGSLINRVKLGSIT
jgi:2-keto-4-pentenoate hydratase/2-oxohepta-3-ene-1,7-dioic acid hydratase in catechol pathway